MNEACLRVPGSGAIKCAESEVAEVGTGNWLVEAGGACEYDEVGDEVRQFGALPLEIIE